MKRLSLPRLLCQAMLTIACAGCMPAAWAFDLPQLQHQLQSQHVVRGSFMQQKFLRSLPEPLTSTGIFTLAASQGLLWQVRTPLHQDILVTGTGIFRRDDGGKWQALSQQAGAYRETSLFLDMLRGDTQSLEQNFAVRLSGSARDWQLILTPQSAVLKQIFEDIRISGGKLVGRIELRETQGDRTVMELKNTRADNKLNDDEVQDFAS